MLDLTKWMADRWMARWGEVLEAVLPAGVRLREVERSAVVAALEACHGNKTHAAVRLGISRRALYRLIDAYGVGAATLPKDPS